MNNMDYYKGGGGDSIMNHINYNEDVLDYLLFEAMILSKILTINSYTNLIEMGCDKLRLSNACIVSGANYIGANIRDENIVGIMKEMKYELKSSFHNPIADIFFFQKANR